MGVRLAFIAILSTLLIINTSCISSREWNLVWIEDFQSDQLDDDVWTIIPQGKLGWNKYMSDSAECCEISDGILTLRGIPIELDNDSISYLTGGIYTKDKFEFKPGKIEIRAKIKGARGAWPAFWMSPFTVENGWPKDGEIDIMEHLNYDSYVYQTVHTYYTKKINKDAPKSFVLFPIKQNEYNIYGVEIKDNELVFSVNGEKTLIYPRISREEENNIQYPFERGWYLMLDMQLGGNWVGKIDPSTLPAEILIDWVKYYLPKR